MCVQIVAYTNHTVYIFVIEFASVATSLPLILQVHDLMKPELCDGVMY